ncbi:MAG: hypothetical protein U0165_16415 [Polyangiaceae bacterium]
MCSKRAPYYKPEEYSKFRPSRIDAPYVWLLAAMGIGETLSLSVTVGRNVGGSSVPEACAFIRAVCTVNGCANEVSKICPRSISSAHTKE